MLNARVAAAELTLGAADARLLLENVFHSELQGERLVFDRCYDEDYGCDGGALRQHPGATISFATDAAAAVLSLHYNEMCGESCPGSPPDGCYHPKWKCTNEHDGMCGTCKGYCAPKLYVDGIRSKLPPSVEHKDYVEGEVDFPLWQESERSSLPRRIEIVMPWNADVSFVRVRLKDVARTWKPKPKVFRYVAYGDSITHGFCADTPYPEHIGRENVWSALNLGIGGISITPRHGIAVADLNPDLISILIGTNNWPWACDVSGDMRGFLDNIRRRLPDLPIVVSTPITRGEEGTMNRNKCATLEDTRQQIRSIVQKRQRSGDRRIFLVEGHPLLPMYHLHDRLHPGDGVAMRDLAFNLNAQMGFAKVQFEVMRCPSLRVRAYGLSPKDRVALYYGLDLVNSEIDSADGCQGRTLMVGGERRGWERARADEFGQAIIEVEDIANEGDCKQMRFQVLDLTTCVSSKVGLSSEMGDSLVGTAAALFPRFPPPPPPSPPPMGDPPPPSPRPTSPPPQPSTPLEESSISLDDMSELASSASNVPGTFQSPQPSLSVPSHQQPVTSEERLNELPALSDWMLQTLDGPISPWILLGVSAFFTIAGAFCSLCMQLCRTCLHDSCQPFWKKRRPSRKHQGPRHELVAVVDPDDDL